SLSPAPVRTVRPRRERQPSRSLPAPPEAVATRTAAVLLISTCWLSCWERWYCAWVPARPWREGFTDVISAWSYRSGCCTGGHRAALGLRRRAVALRQSHEARPGILLAGRLRQGQHRIP